MAEKITVARPYARALFDQAQSTGTIDAWQHVLVALGMIAKELLGNHLNDNPSISAEQLENLLGDVLMSSVDIDPKIKEQAANFIHLVVFEKRITVLPEIAVLFHDMVMAAGDQMEVDVFAPCELSADQKQKVIHVLEKRFKATVTVVTHIDETLIGGMVIRAGNWVMDGSVKGKLTRLAESLV